MFYLKTDDRGPTQMDKFLAVFNVENNLSVFVKQLKLLNIMTCKSGLFELLATAMPLLLNWILYSNFGFCQVDALHLLELSLI